MRQVLRETVDLYEDLAESRGVTLTIEPPADAALSVRADHARLRQALSSQLRDRTSIPTLRAKRAPGSSTHGSA